MESYNVIGIMSGTSLDGLDICYAQFSHRDDWNFIITAATTAYIPSNLKEKLANGINLSGLEISFLNNEMGNFIGNAVNHFIEDFKISKKEIDFISSHGHTIFHQPNNNLTLQIGNGANISAITQLAVICDFRTTDLALNGNGAPLVPIGDKLLFSDFDCCLNIGGIANISFNKNGERMAYDICPANMVLNYIANKLNLAYDKDGEIAKSGSINETLLNELNELCYYQQTHPKSLGYEWVSKTIFPLLNDSEINLLRTLTEHMAQQIGKNLTGKTLATGGGVFNTFLIERIKNYSGYELIIPDKELVNYKEALIFAFLGILRWRNEPNILKSVTGAYTDNIGGCIYNALPN